MPIEIRELIIRATVDPPKGGNQPAAPASTGGAMSDAVRQQLVQECVEQVMDALKRQHER